MTKWLQRVLQAGIVILLIVMPFHTPLTVGLGHYFGYRAVLQAWKEALVVLLTLAALGLIFLSPPLRQRLLRPLNLVAVSFIALSLVVSLIARPPLIELLFGVKTDLVMLVVFLIAQVASRESLIRIAERVLLITSALVAGFGVAQMFLLPRFFLTNIGYDVSTVVPFQVISADSDTIRILSTLIGANQLGAFLILPIALVFARLLQRPRYWHFLLLAVMGVAMVGTYSRSSWIGMLVALFVVAFALLPRKIFILASLGACGVLLISGLAVNYSIQHNSLLQNIFLHASMDSDDNPVSDPEAGSNSQHASLVHQGLVLSLDHPLGLGLGTAGPASRYDGSGIITENYYLQLSIETGIAGLFLFLLLGAALLKALWSQQRKNPLGASLFAAYIGVSVVGLFLHSWADSALALIFWALAGLSVVTSSDKTLFIDSSKPG